MSAGTTIAAIATPAGPADRGAIRVSGPDAARLVLATWSGAAAPALGARGAFRGRFDDGRGEQPLLLLWMPGPRSYTREDVAEFHLPGAPPLLARALERLFELGAVPAQPGEFTRRAFEHGRIDLSRAEGVLELVAASSVAERRAALALLSGGLARRVEALRAGLEELRALCEASLDFDESDTGHVPRAELERLAGRAAAELAAALAWELRRAPESGAPEVVLCGAPNAGKSTLFNALCEDGEALVSELAGTTRDGASGPWRLGRGAALLVDAPGLDAGAAGADAGAQERARARQAGAALLLWVVDAGRDDRAALVDEAAALPADVPRLLVWSRVDRPGARPAPPAALASLAPLGALAVSARTGAGLAALAERAAQALGLAEAPDAAEPAGGAEAGLAAELSARHRAALEAARAELERGRAAWRAGAPLDQFAEALRGATARLDAISGRTTPEDLLDRIFARFCLGK